MIAYYPYYIEPARYVVENFVAPTLNLHSEDNCIDFFAGGSCPETYGIFQALQNIFYDNADITIFDEENGWFPYQKTTWSLCSEIFAEQDVRSYTFAHRRCRIGKDFADDLDFVGRLKKTKIFFLQNYLSHMSDKPESVEKFLNWFSAVTKQTTSAAFFILIDLNYNSVATVFRRLVDENFLQTNSLKKIAAHIPDDGEPLTIRHGDTLQSLRDNIFDDNDGLKQKKNTNFYFVVLQKI